MFSRYISTKEFDTKMRKIQRKNNQIELRNKLKSEKNKFKQHNKMKTSNVVLIASIIAIISFTIACLYIQYETEIEVSSTLITLWYSFWTVEIVALTGIKITKVIKDYDSSSKHSTTSDSDEHTLEECLSDEFLGEDIC